MKEQKQEIIRIVEDQRLQGRTITEILRDLHIKQPTYYSWLKPKNKTPQRRTFELTPEEKHAIETGKG